MSDAVLPSLGIVAYLALFATVGIVFLLANLVLGWFLRPHNPHPEKLEIYECGEPAVGSSFVQFDLRFYVVALLFIIFDVEVAFFFPWATVFGKATHMADVAGRAAVLAPADEDQQQQLTRAAAAVEGLYREMGIRDARLPNEAPASVADRLPDSSGDLQRRLGIVHLGARQLAKITIVDIGVFFAILMVGFAYVWVRGDLNWVRAYRGHQPQETTTAPDEHDLEQALSA